MSKLTDSRDPVGIGALILQHHGYADNDVPDYARGSIVGVRVLSRYDAENEDAEWEEDPFARGPISGAHFWGRADANAGSYRFGWVAVTAVDQESTTSAGGGTTGDPTAAPASGRGGNGGAGESTPWYLTGALEGLDPYPTTPGGEPDWEKLYELAKAGKIEGLTAEKLNYIAQNYATQVKGVSIRGGISYPTRIIVGSGLSPGSSGLVGGAFGIGVPGLNLNPNAGAIGGAPNVFGVGLEALLPTFVLRADDEYFGPNPSGFTALGNQDRDHAANAGKLNDASDQATAAYYYDGSEYVGTGYFPADSTWLPDRRHFRLTSQNPLGWPQFPRGYYGIVHPSSIDNEQIDLWVPTDPRLVASNYKGPPSMGTPVADMGGANHSLDPLRHAPLQSLVRVVRGPSGHKGMLKSNAGRDEGPRNWLARNIGPSGQWDVCGGLVCDIPTGRNGTIARESRILAMESCVYGGPFDVGHYGDLHELGSDQDGNPINSLHISTDALFKYRGSVFEDGPLWFEAHFPDDPGELEHPIYCHLAFNPRYGDWEWWTTSAIYTPPNTGVPTEPPDRPPPESTEPPMPPGTDPPGGEVEPGPGPYGGSPGPYSPDPRAPRDKRPRDPTDPRGKGPTGIFGGRNLIGGPGNADDPPQFPAAVVRELLMPSVAFRPQLQKKGELDLRTSSPTVPSRGDIRLHDERAPTVARLEAWGAQQGTVGGPYLTTGGEYTYTREPKRWNRPTTAGGLLLMPPEVTMSDVDDDFAPDGVTRSTVYLAAGPGAYFGAGVPELATGGLRDGYSWGSDGSGGLDFRLHDSSGDVTDTVPFADLGEVQTKDGADFLASELRDVLAGGQKQVGVRVDAGNEALQVNIGGTIFGVTIT